MSHRYCLNGVHDESLLTALLGLVKCGDELLSDLLAHLAELDERRLYLDLGFPSLFAYCTQTLGMCESSAGRRILAARVCRRFAGSFERVGRGELNLSALCALSPHLNSGNAAELVALCARRSRRDTEVLLAARFPKPDVRDLVRRLPSRVAAPAFAGSVQREVSAEVGARSKAASAETCTAFSAGADAESAGRGSVRTPVEAASRRPQIEALSLNRFGVHFTADAEFRDLLERARALAGHRLPAGEMAEVLKLALRAFIRETEKQRFALGRKPRRVSEVRGTYVEQAELLPSAQKPSRAGSHPPGERGAERGSKRPRHIAAAVAREVYLRDAGGCTFVSADGRRCGSRVFLEVDHVNPWAAGGESSVANLRLRCRAHNQGHARSCFGASHIARAVARKSTRTQL